MISHSLLSYAAAAILTVLAGVDLAQAQSLPPDIFVPECTLSPNRQYGVLVADFDKAVAGSNAFKNQLVAIPGQRVVLTMEAIGWSRSSYPGGLPPDPYKGEINQPRWSEDSSLLLWKVAGKWTPHAVELVKLAGGKVKWQLDLLTTAQQAILRRTRKAVPQAYAAIKKEHVGFGSAYPDGFTVDVSTEGEEGKSVSLPLVVHADLTSNPKPDPGKKLEAQLDGVVDKDGSFSVTRFELYGRPTSSW